MFPKQVTGEGWSRAHDQVGIMCSLGILGRDYGPLVAATFLAPGRVFDGNGP